MSSGLAFPSVTDVMPDVSFPPPEVLAPPPVQMTAPPSDVLPGAHVLPTAHLPNTVSDPVGVTQHLGDHLLHNAMAEAHHLVAPALTVLGSLSGALLAGRVVMAGAQLLSEAALRAGQVQQELRGQQLSARRAAACWHDAVCAAARVNARITTLNSCVRRAAEDPDRPPDGGPGGPVPVVPPLVDPVGMSLEEVWRGLAETDCLLRRAEAAYSRSVLTAPRGAAGGMGDEARTWHERLRTKRRGELKAYEQAATWDVADSLRTPPPPAFTPGALTADEVLHQGADLIASLPLHLPAGDYRLLEEKVAAAAAAADTRPAAAGRQLREAKVYAQGLWTKAARREAAAGQLGFLKAAPPDIPLPDAAAEVAALEAFLHEDRPLGKDVQQAVDARIAERTRVFQQMYTAEAMAAALGVTHVVGVAAYAADGGTRITDWRPPGWDADHWLRISVAAAGTVRVSTQHRPRTPDEDTPEALHLDRERCAEAIDYLQDVRRLTGLAGLDMPFEFEDPPDLPGVTPTDHRPAHHDDLRVRTHDPESRP